MIAQPGTLLVVEDDGDVREFLAGDLRARGYRTETSGSCGDAIGQLRKQSFDVVLCDVQLPDGDGLSVLRWCQQRPDPPVVILLTGYGSIESAVEAMRAGADDYLTKPIVDDELVESLSRAMARRIDGVGWVTVSLRKSTRSIRFPSSQFDLVSRLSQQLASKKAQ